MTNRFSQSEPSQRPLAAAARSWTSFWFAPREPLALHAIRFLAGLLFLSWLLAFAGQHEALFGLGGWFDLEAYRETARLREGTPAPITWSVLYLCGTNATLLTAVYWVSVGVLVLFTFGFWPRLTAVLAWVVVASFSANPATSYPGDYLLLIVAFYLMIGYVLLGPWGRRRATARGGREPQPEQSHAANLAIRLLQVHFALAIVVSALHKLQFGEWWSGAALWYPMNPTLEMTPEKLRALAPEAQTRMLFLSIATYAVLAWQLSFPLFAWRPRWRILLLGGAALGWAGSVFLYHEPLFGPVLFLASLTYLTPAEWRGAVERLGRLRGLLSRRRATGIAAPAPRPVEAAVRA